ncbi:hypothetical protein Plim_0783 [Planctopirus limnophila DSM 3776]|uniref:Uncharacterized protein n=2 Tax=Planctopirus TaxID=1649480 RepID=D5SRU4_PLAL2|nr:MULTISPECIES: hypothetical protein [Planctopirus]ADG66628.1 hypothetical protein Plim_0783 [Planctopirus limnophila DSM 3776]ODA28391.1 hypothetical protein A6X21_11665 [Planctopirus hydrillae]
MGFLKKFFKNTYRDGGVRHGKSSFDHLDDEQLEAHLNIAKYGSFMLTDAVRPSYDLQVVPRAGYRHDAYHDKETGIKIPVIMASVSKEHLLDVFIDLMAPLGDEVDVVLETSHERRGGHQDLYRESIDVPILKSTLYDFEDLLLNDGCTGFAVLNPNIPLEIQLDEHKLIIIYGNELVDFKDILDDYNIDCNEDLKFITEAEHVHSSSEDFSRQFRQLQYRLGIDDE